jgi:protein-L-isoaspartate O-methyltransferase
MIATIGGWSANDVPRSLVHSIDSKGRMSIPLGFRTEIAA